MSNSKAQIHKHSFPQPQSIRFNKTKIYFKEQLLELAVAIDFCLSINPPFFSRSQIRYHYHDLINSPLQNQEYLGTMKRNLSY